MIRTDSEEINEWVEMTVDLYESIDSVREHNTNTQPLQHTGSESKKIRSPRSVLVCLVVLCVLLLTAVIVLCVLIYTNNHQFNINNKNNTQERDQLLTNNTKLTEERDQLLTNNTKLTQERDRLLTKIQELNKENRQLNHEKNGLLKCFYEKDGWKHFQLRCYFISSEEKSWAESRRYCRNRGADLIIINNKEEQDFVKQISSTFSFWIGLTYSNKESKWKWVDGSTMNYSSWASEKPSGGRRENCAVSHISLWNNSNCDHALKWICEMNLPL